MYMLSGLFGVVGVFGRRNNIETAFINYSYGTHTHTNTHTIALECLQNRQICSYRVCRSRQNW